MADIIAYKKTALTGGSASALDGISGAVLFGGEFAHVMVGGVVYIYELNATSGAAESIPDIIAPDVSPGNKRWILQQMGKAATTTFAGVSELATNAEAAAMTDALRALTPSTAAYLVSMLTNPKAMSQGVYLTGATSGSSGLRASNNANLNMNYNNFTIHFENLCLPDYTPAAVQILAQKWEASVGWSLELLANGYLGLYINAGPYKYSDNG
jgi:hypothetical protein